MNIIGLTLFYIIEKIIILIRGGGHKNLNRYLLRLFCLTAQKGNLQQKIVYKRKLNRKGIQFK